MNSNQSESEEKKIQFILQINQKDTYKVNISSKKKTIRLKI